MEVKVSKNRFMVVELQNHVMPVFEYCANKPWVSFGKNNNYPDYLIELYNRNAVHGALVKGKSDYVYGKGLTFERESSTILEAARIENFIDHANRYESWNEVYKKTCSDYELFNGFAWQIIWNNGGRIAEVYRVELGKCRRSKDGKKVYYCDSWSIDNNGTVEPNPNPERHPSFKEFDVFNPSIRTGTQIFYYKKDEPTADPYGYLYPIPEYSGAVADIETDVEITNFHFHNLKNGMFASAILSLFNGVPSKQEQKKLKKMFNYTHSGTLNTGKVMLTFNDKGGQAPDLKTITQSDLDKMFEQLGKRLQQNIFTAHRADPVLFGVMTEGSLSDTGGRAVLNKWDKFLRAYVEKRQESILDQIKFIASVNGLDVSKLNIEQTTPVGIELPEDPKVLLELFDRATVQKAYAKKYGIEVEVVEAEGEVMSALPVNENIKSLTGMQYKRLQGYIAKYKAGKITYDEAAHLIKGYGLGDDYVSLVLGQRFSKHESALALFEKFAIDDNDDPVIKEEFVCGETAALKLELSMQKFEQADPELQYKLLDLLAGDPTLTPEKAAKMLGVNPLLILAAITALLAGGYIVESARGVYQPTEKAIKRDIEKVKTETYTVYAYVTRPDVPEAENSRPFCKKLLKMSREGKRWTREAIEEITNELGEDAWVYRGGFYTNPEDGETTPYCRHIWKGIIKSRRKK